MHLQSVSASPSFWSFDNNTLDGLSIYNAAGVNSPTYRTPGINGYGSALSVNRASSQYVTASSFRNLSYTSFTVEMWFYSTALTSSDYGLFGQYYAQTADQSLHYIIRSYNLYMAFFNDDLAGSSTIQVNTWYHVAFAYDYSSLTQKNYLNGKLDGSRSSNAYQGLSGSIVIGKTEQVPVTLGLNATVVSITSVTGRVNQAISFTSSSSYYQVGGFVLLGISNYAYSIALWVRPASINGSILVHLSTTTNGQGWCADFIGFSSTGQIIAAGWTSTPQQVIGPILPANVWTHVVSTYSTTNGVRLYVNGTLIGTTGAMTYSASGLVNILTLANYIQGIQGSAGGTCSSQSIVPNIYYGYIDEFRVYSRELNSTDIYILANP